MIHDKPLRSRMTPLRAPENDSGSVVVRLHLPQFS